MDKELKITVPEGYCIDKENSTFECIKFKPKLTKLNYDTVAKALFKEKEGFYIGIGGDVRKILGIFHDAYPNPNNCTSEKQAEKLMAINKLMNVAKFLNGDWKPDWSNIENKYYPYLNSDNIPSTGITTHNCVGIVHFRNPTYIKQAIDILGEDTIRLALSTNW